MDTWPFAQKNKELICEAWADAFGEVEEIDITPSSKERILVTGGAGFMGSWIAEEFLKLGHEVFIVDNLNTGDLRNIPEGADYAIGDAADEAFLHGVFRVFKPDVVYSLAAFAREGTSLFSPKACVRDNVNAHVVTLSEAIRSPNFRKIVYFSSMAVYGDQKPPFPEYMQRSPCDPYGWSKALCEGVTESMSKVFGYDYSIVRPHNVFGERQSLRDRQRNVIGIFINAVMRKEPLTIYGTGENTRAFSYIRNSIKAYTNLLNCGSGQIYNVGDNRPVSILEVANTVLSEMGQLGWKPVEIIHYNDRPLEVKHAHTTFDKQSDIGYIQSYSFQQGVRLMANWGHKEGPQPWLNIPVELIHQDMPEVWR